MLHGLEDAAGSIDTADDYLRFNGFSIQWDGGCYLGHMMMRDTYYGPDGAETRGRHMMDPKNIEAVMRPCVSSEAWKNWSRDIRDFTVERRHREPPRCADPFSPQFRGRVRQMDEYGRGQS